jgi:hypothetical protein
MSADATNLLLMTRLEAQRHKPWELIEQMLSDVEVDQYFLTTQNDAVARYLVGRRHQKASENVERRKKHQNFRKVLDEQITSNVHQRMFHRNCKSPTKDDREQSATIY